MQEKDQNIEALLQSYTAILQQGEILGEETVRPLLGELESRILGLVPTELNEDQQRVLSAWETLTQTTEQLGLEMPAPSGEVLEVLEANNRYTTVLSALGELGIVSPSTVDEEIVVEPKPITTSTNLPSDNIELDEDQGDIGDDISKTEQEIVEKVVIVSGNTTFTPKPQRAGMYLKILDKLSKSGSDGFSTTEYVRELTGGYSSRELQLISNGEKELPAGLDLKEARRISSQFYAALGVLKAKNMLVHESGSMPGTVNRNDSVNSANSGFVKPLSRISITEEDGVATIDLSGKHYKVSIDEYEQAIDNGVGTKQEFKKDPNKFSLLSKALGSIATQNPENQARFTRKSLSQWLREEYGVELGSIKEQSALSSDLREVISRFEGDFPLSEDGIKGGAHFIWQDGVEVNIQSGFPEKPDFENAVIISLALDGTLTVEIDGVEHSIAQQEDFADASRMHPDLSEKELLMNFSNRSKQYLECLSILGKSDTILLKDIAEDMHSAQKDISYETVANWIREFTRKLNTLSGSEVVNWRVLNGVYIDVNRRFVFKNNNTDEINQVDEVVDEAPANTIEASSEASSELDIPQAQAETKLSPTVDDALKSASELDDKTKSLIRGRLVERGRFEYPKQLGEAVYLLELIMDKETYAQLRESDRLVRQDYSNVNQFISEVMLACYFRTLSWGKFDELVDSIAQSPQTSISSHAASKGRELKSLTVDSIKKDISGNRNSADAIKYEEDSLLALMDGWVRPPKTPLQAVTLLDTFRRNRSLIVDGKTPEQVELLVSEMQDKAGEVLGVGNLQSLLSGRQQGRAKTNGRAVQTSSGEETALSRTDTYRFPDHQSHRKNKRRKARNR